jgi:uncharacterized protein (TIGR02996 family)
MSTEDGFIRALREDPQDDETRLIFADWLDERDDPRGEFFRLQTELADWVPDLERRQSLHQRCAELLARHGRDWLGQLSDLCEEIVWERGQPHVAISIPALLGSEIAPLFESAIVGQVRVLERAGRLDELVAGHHFEYLPHLHLDRLGLEDRHLVALAANPHFRGVRTLSLATNSLTEAGLRRLLASPGAADLTALDLRNNRLHDDAVWELMSWDGLARLNDLDVHGNAIGPVALETLSAWRRSRLAERPGHSRRINSLGMEFVWIPAGTYLRGALPDDPDRHDDESPRYATTLSRGFYLGRFQVTQGQYQRVVGTNPSRFNAGNHGGFNHPVEMVSWEEASEFCVVLGALPAEKKVGHRYRLPTESEWEHAARCGWDHTVFPWDRRMTPWLANYGETVGHTVPVGSYPPNPWGLCDMTGNLWDWCADWSELYPKNLRQPLLDPRGPRSGSQRVLRGGSWYGPAQNVRCSSRGSDSPTTHDHYYGFRVVLEVGADRP